MNHSRIEIISDGQHVRIIKQGRNRDISDAVETACFTDPVVRACCIVAVAGMLEKKHPDLFVQLLRTLDVEPPTQAAKDAQTRRIKQLMAA